jgi:hypothetical protein
LRLAALALIGGIRIAMSQQNLDENPPKPITKSVRAVVASEIPSRHSTP